MELPEHQAYNLTRECYLCKGVAIGDFSRANRKEWLARLGEGSGIWMKPFRGIQKEETQIPIDLLYLDEDCCVIEAVESFPSASVSPSIPPAATVLAMTTHSIESSQTKRGDRLIICLSEEMPLRLKHASSVGAHAAAGPAAISPDQAQVEDHPLGPEHQRHPSSHHMPHPEAPKKLAAGIKSWLQHWFQSEPPGPHDGRESPRKPGTGFSASFWTGGTPQVYEIRDVSDTGLYVVTDERWYPGTLVRITLTMPDDKSLSGHRSVVVEAKAVRWGNDGVGLEFVL